MGPSFVPRDLHVLVTCEHGGCHVPEQYISLFRGKDDLLKGHRGYDAGALDIARSISRKLKARLFHSRLTRLLVDLNRSDRNPRVFSELSAALPEEERKKILRKYHEPYRRNIERYIDKMTRRGSFVLHISVHTFTPILKGRARNADIGLLYDPSRKAELRICSAVKKLISAKSPALKVRRNYPYLGISDGLTTHLRKQFNDDIYAGIELEVNQRLQTPSCGTRLNFTGALSGAFGSLDLADMSERHLKC